MEFTLLGAAAIAVAALYGMLRWEARRGSATGSTHDLWEIALVAAVAGVFSGRIAAMISDGVNPLANPADILIVRAGVATGWASLAAIGMAAWQGRGELWPVLDGLAAASLAGLAGWHAGCLARDACLGAASDVPWAMTQPGSAIGRHPVEIYAAIALAAAAIALSWWRSARHATPGAAAGLALAAAGAVRLLTEPLRPSLTTGPVLWYGAAVVVGLVITRAVRRGVSVTGSGGAAGAAPDRG